MRLVRYRRGGRIALGAATDAGVLPLAGGEAAAASIAEAVEQGAAPEPSAPPTPWPEVEILAPLDPSARIFCIGLNYRAHVEESGRDLPPQPSTFIRTQQSLVGPGQPMLRPRASTHYDYEGELAVVIGRPTAKVAAEDALAAVGGYCCFNDGSLRDFQKHAVTAGKNFDSSGAIGPWIVTADEIGAPGALTIITRLNGEVMQQASTTLMIYPLDQIVSYLSNITTLLPGDVIATGTPAGVGSRRTPPLWMKPGDRIEVEIAGVGLLSNPIGQA